MAGAPRGSLFLYFLFNDIAQYQKSYWPNTHPDSQPLGMSFLQDRRNAASSIPIRTGLTNSISVPKYHTSHASGIETIPNQNKT